jgi:hypothetical protein
MLIDLKSANPAKANKIYFCFKSTYSTSSIISNTITTTTLNIRSFRNRNTLHLTQNGMENGGILFFDGWGEVSDRLVSAKKWYACAFW